MKNNTTLVFFEPGYYGAEQAKLIDFLVRHGFKINTTKACIANKEGKTAEQASVTTEHYVTVASADGIVKDAEGLSALVQEIEQTFCTGRSSLRFIVLDDRADQIKHYVTFYRQF